MASPPSAPDPTPPPLAPDSASAPEKSARSAPTAKLRSCVVCRSRKVRCDKLSPCSNCRRANIPCVVPSNDRPPRWARRLERFNGDAQTESRPSGDQALERLQTLENLVKELRGQLEVANASSRGASSDAASPPENVKIAASPSSSTASDVQKHFGRMVLKDANQRRYIASGFWSRISDELEGLQMDTRRMGDDGASSEDDDFPASTPSTQEQHREPAERHAFLFQNDMSPSSLGGQDFNPLPSQIPFLLDVFEENMNIIMHVVHMPSIRKMVRSSRGSKPQITFKHQALLFSIYYAAITSMEDEDVLTNFGATKTDLNLKFRRGLEQTLARADFLNDPDIVHVQTLTIFLSLARRYDSPVYIWMMTGLLIRMARSVGLHRDGSQFSHLSPFEVEQRRRLWWMVIVVDIRASEDQGTEFTVTEGSFDTKMPLNINDSDIEPETKEMPPERQGVTDMSLGVAMCELAFMSMQLMASSPQTGGTSLEDQARLLESHRSKLEEGYAKYSTDPDDIINWVGVVVTRIVLSKLTLLVYLPSLFASPSDQFSDEVRDKLLTAAIEIAEHNHALNAETRCRQWRWIYQTYTHWYAIVWLLIEISRRQWSPTIERAWIALHSPWLIPSQNSITKDVRMWIPLRKLMDKARSHRASQLEQIRKNPSLVETLERIDGSLPIPVSPDSSQPQSQFLEHWRSLVWETAKMTLETDSSNNNAQIHNNHGRQHLNASSDPSHFNSGHRSSGFDGTELNTPPTNWVNSQPMDTGVGSWLWTDPSLETEAFTDIDMNMDIDTDIDWNTWLQSATGLEMNAGKPSLT
ncbi:uncharacterized protein FIESC28_09351 [Fusarium coffeatum]|uniref:Zn(2)-C6 fungal-type domain-containing protein n=1 Tax=Fusarium coffeatum TaxID=231269 RepID=A0A366R0K9_9HYPO|nr:uncharacterized protein FIESC28_09351 [Fusarium coffeatum]RBR10704.1 hypothetical protein FIESC28_09351 [Fusarium coffeatum]